MPTLKEIKGRIGSVQNTLKITSAMKLVSSAKLRKAQVAIENMRPYEEKLLEILALARGTATEKAGFGGQTWQNGNLATEKAGFGGQTWQNGNLATEKAGFGGQSVGGDTVIVAMASNSSLCGGFNANAIAKAKSVLKDHPKATVYSIGRKMADAMRKAGYPSPKDLNALSEHPTYGPVSELVDKFLEDDSNVILVYNHFVSTGKQVPVAEPLFGMAGQAGHDEDGAVIPGPDSPVIPVPDTPVIPGSDRESPVDAIIEPTRKELLKALYPKTLKIKLFAALLDSAAAEHAARTVAMQTATDNGEDLLAELTLQYNKGRQQKITNEILDLAGGQQGRD